MKYILVVWVEREDECVYVHVWVLAVSDRLLCEYILMMSSAPKAQKPLNKWSTKIFSNTEIRQFSNFLISTWFLNYFVSIILVYSFKTTCINFLKTIKIPKVLSSLPNLHPLRKVVHAYINLEVRDHFSIYGSYSSSSSIFLIVCLYCFLTFFILNITCWFFPMKDEYLALLHHTHIHTLPTPIFNPISIIIMFKSLVTFYINMTISSWTCRVIWLYSFACLFIYLFT